MILSTPRPLGSLLLVAFFLVLPLSTAAQEIALALALVAALAGPRRGALTTLPWGRPALALGVICGLLSGASGDLREGARQAWLLAPLVVLPALSRPGDRERLTRIGLGAAVVVALWASFQRLAGGVGHAGLSHHLSLAYALLPPFGVAVAAKRGLVAIVLGLGVAATGSEGAAIALCVTLVAASTRRPLAATGVGGLITLLLLSWADSGELRQRAVLWTGGLGVAETGAVGPGAYVAASTQVYDRLIPGFWFPNHAHDSAVQVLAVLGPAGALALAWLCLVCLRRGAAGASAGLAGVLVGGLTQDVFGDLEVARAVWAWLALGGVAAVADSHGTGARPMDTEAG